ncbi:MAG: hypothetical protein AABX61_03650 [Nanoarchaeota archaeon]
MSNHSLRETHGRILPRNVTINTDLSSADEVKSEKISANKINEYLLLQQDATNSEAYILSKKFSLDLKYAQEAIKLLRSYSEAIEFTDLFFKVTDGRIDYLQTLRLAHKEGFSVLKKETSLLEQEVMNFQNKFGINPNETEIRILEKNGDLKPRFISGREGCSKILNTKELTFNVRNLLFGDSVEESFHYLELPYQIYY